MKVGMTSKSMQREKNVPPGLNSQVYEAKKLTEKHKLQKA